MKRKSGGVVVAHRIDVLLDHLYHLFAHDVSYPSREEYFDRLDRGSKATAALVRTDARKTNAGHMILALARFR